MMWVLLAFVAVPLIEIGLFIKVGGWLTLWPTLGIVLLTWIIGTFLVRQQGLKVLGELRKSMSTMRDPLSPLAHGAMILFAGALLLTPGFFTDAVGFALLAPPLRRAIVAILASRITAASFTTSRATGHRHSDDDVIEAEYEDLTEATRKEGTNNRPSGWTEH